MTDTWYARLRAICLSAFAAGAVTLSAPAVAGGDDIVVRVGEAGTVTRLTTVSSAGLDLGSAEGRQMLDSRIKRAAQKVCGYNSMHGLRSPATYTDCADRAVGDARAQASQLATSRAGGGTGQGAR